MSGPSPRRGLRSCTPLGLTCAPPGRPDEALLLLGEDKDGMPIEVVGIGLADGRLRVIHAMPMRPAYHDLYEEATKWRQ